ncbi:MAG: hypothetical protein GY841_02985 [FCB group bacterium]|nr:hypothetical protein [FCB group bacterium]
MSSFFTVICMLVSILFLMPVAFASDTEPVASLMWGNTRDVAVEGDYAFYTAPYGLIVFDISTPGDPVEVSRLFLTRSNETADEIVINGDYAYIVQGEYGLAIVDISDPSDPQLLLYYPTSKPIIEMKTEGDFIYFTAGRHLFENDFHILDISDRENPELRNIIIEDWGSYPFVGFDIDGAYACLISRDDGFLVLDISDPDHPEVAAEYNPDEEISSAQMENNLVYAAAGNDGLIVYNLFDPYGPTEVDRFDTYPVEDVVISGDYAYLEAANAYNSYSVVDISNPASLTLVADNPTSMLAIRGMKISDNRLMIRNIMGPSYEAYGLQIFDISEPHNSTLWGEYYPPNDPDIICTDGDFAYVGNALNGFSIIDVSNPAAPLPIGSAPLAGRAGGLSVEGDYAYVTMLGDNTLYVVDVADPALSVVVGTYEAHCLLGRVMARGDYVYLIADDVQAENLGLLILDVSDHSAPQLVAEYQSTEQTPVIPKCLDIEGDYLYLGYWKYRVGDGFTGLHILDIADPTDPQLVSIFKEGDFETHAFYGVDVVGDYAYITFRGGIDLMVLDVSDPADPQVVATVPTPSEPEYVLNYNLFVSENRAYVSATHNGLKVFDLYKIDSPVLSEKFSTPGMVCDAAKIGEHFYLADLFGLMVVEGAYYEPPAGDANNDEAINIGDIVYLINFVFKNGMAPYSMRAGDVNKDVSVNVGDAVYLINFTFKSGPEPQE